MTRVKAGGEHGYQYVYLHMRNRGNVMVKSTGKLVVTDSHRRAVATRGFAVDTFLPRTGIDYPVVIPRKALLPGRYSATVSLGSAGRQLLGYRKRGVGFHFRRTFGFTVSTRERTKVFAGVPAATPPPRQHSSDGFPTAMLGWIIAAIAALVAAASVISRRWAAR